MALHLVLCMSVHICPNPNSPPWPYHLAAPLHFAPGRVGLIVPFLWGSNGSVDPALKMTLQTECCQVQTLVNEIFKFTLAL